MANTLKKKKQKHLNCDTWKQINWQKLYKWLINMQSVPALSNIFQITKLENTKS